MSRKHSAGCAIMMICLGLITPLLAAEVAPGSPAWLGDLSLGVKESYDDNVYLSGVDPKYLPATFTVPKGSAVALENRASWVTTVSPRIGVNFAPLLGAGGMLSTLSLTYAPDFVLFHAVSAEDFNTHRVTAAIQGKGEVFSYSVDNTLTFVEGARLGPTYPGALLSAFATAVTRERREQFQDRSGVSLRYDCEKVFVRPVASLAYYELETEQLEVPGYQNYVDRYDVNGGVDLGWKYSPKMAATLGYRYGHQYQQQLAFVPYSSPSDYQRVLLGVEGQPWDWLEVRLQGGPDFRDYQADSANHITPVSDHHPVKYYGEASCSARLSANDTLSFKYRQFQWVSSTGKVPYFDSTYELAYHRKLTSQLVGDVGGKILTWDYTSGNLASCRRNDSQYTVWVGLGYAFNAHASLSASYSLDLGRNAQDNVVHPQTREFSRNMISMAALIKF